MRRVKAVVMGLATLVMMLVLGVFSVGSASAHEFKTTGPLPALILVLSTNSQIFKIGTELGTVVCAHFRGHGVGPATSMSATEQIITGTYSTCKLMAGSSAVVISPAEYLITAEGLVSILKQITLHVNVGACTVKVFSGGEVAANGKLEKLSFLNESTAILAHSNVEGIVSEGTGGECGAVGVKNTNGTYTGLLLVAIDGGSLQWE